MEAWKRELYHYGIKGQRWGIRRGPPYPIGSDVEYRVVGSVKPMNGRRDVITDGKTATKKVLIAVGTITLASLVGYGIYKYHDRIISGRTVVEGLIQRGDEEPIKTEHAFDGRVFSNAAEFDSAIKSLRDETRKRADSMFDKQYWDSLSQEQRDAIHGYTDTQFLNINYGLRYGEENAFLKRDIPAFKKAVQNISEAIDGSALASDAVVQRSGGRQGLSEMLIKCGINAEVSGEYIKVKNPEKLIGATFTDNGFYSCSVDPARDERFSNKFKGVLLTTILPKGTKAIYVAPISKSPEETELLVQKGTTFCIKDFVLDNSSGLITELIVEAIQPE